MSKYMRSRHVPLKTDKPEAVSEGFDDFISEIQEAGGLLRALREGAGLSEEELGKEVGVDPEHISLMETGEQPIPLNVAKKLEALFDADYHLFL